VRNPEGAVVCAGSAAGRGFAPVGHLRYLRRQACRGEGVRLENTGSGGCVRGTAALNDGGSGGARKRRQDRADELADEAECFMGSRGFIQTMLQSHAFGRGLGPEDAADVSQLSPQNRRGKRGWGKSVGARWVLKPPLP
jgi:hypothetical protein